MGNVGEGEGVHDSWNTGESVDMDECVSVFQGMGDEVEVLAVVIDAAVLVVFASRK